MITLGCKSLSSWLNIKSCDLKLPIRFGKACAGILVRFTSQRHDNLSVSRSDEFSGMVSALFLDSKVQAILQRLNSLDVNKIFSVRKEKLTTAKYKVLTDEEFKKEESKSMEEAVKRLHMPIVRNPRRVIDVVISRDDRAIDHDEDKANFIFTDISSSKTRRNRRIVVRENSTGVLREASWDERDRMHYVYFPREGQSHEILPMLQDAHITRVLQQDRHKDVLDLIYIQCESDDPEYHRVCDRVYSDIDQRELYDLLRSTRHYCGLVFHLVSNSKTNRMLSYFVRSKRLLEAADLVKLHLLLHPGTPLSSQLIKLSDDKLLRGYLEFERMENALQHLDAHDSVEIGLKV